MTDTTDLIQRLRAHQQADEEGVIVKVSRQACDEAADALEQQAAQIAEKDAEIARLISTKEHIRKEINAMIGRVEDDAVLIEALRADAERMRAALEKIEVWYGAFPPTGKFHPEGGEMSFGWCFGSNGEREFMREIARAALRQEQPT